MTKKYLIAALVTIALGLAGWYMVMTIPKNATPNANNSNVPAVHQPPEPSTTIVDFDTCAAVGNPIMESYPRQCNANGKTYVEIIPPLSAEINCEPSQRNADFCTQQYDPVCATVNIQCIKAPCYPIHQTFSNACEACKNSLVPSYTKGTCPEPVSDKYQTKEVTLADNNTTITVPLGQSFLLKLGESYNWDVTINDQSIISRAKNISVVKGAQGVYDALKKGTAVLTATGDPLCRQTTPACAMPSILFTLTIEVN